MKLPDLRRGLLPAGIDRRLAYGKIRTATAYKTGTEAGIGGVPVTLTGTTGDGQPVTLNTTNDGPDGSYEFTGLEPARTNLRSARLRVTRL
ncbi:MAG: hypothetical protein IPN33_17385 [Saprospiraceae bacterium]|nr:hypothetical protein [Saprospiraceae bacterium]